MTHKTIKVLLESQTTLTHLAKQVAPTLHFVSFYLNLVQVAIIFPWDKNLAYTGERYEEPLLEL